MKLLPNITTHFADWYQEVIYQAELTDHSPVRGTMIVRPYGCAIWENIQKIVDDRIKATGHHNALFPLFIPESFLKKEAEHVSGFAPELAVVTHAGGKKLEEPLIVRPTSETIIHYMFAKWINSWRDLPLKINQWANVVRWEMRPRPFLRTTEFFWQEGHTAHQNRQEALDHAHTMLQEYVNLAHNYLAIPVITGHKTDQEKFPGAEITLTFEAIMQDGKALQMGTSHLLSQSFAHAFDMKFQDKQGQIAYPYLTSWGVTTRLIGALIMVHGDQKGLVLPPRIAPIQVVIIPIAKNEADAHLVYERVNDIEQKLKNAAIRTYIDNDKESTPGAKFYKWELKGVPIRLEIGKRDIEQNQAIAVTRYDGKKVAVSLSNIENIITEMLDSTHHNMMEKARTERAKLWHIKEKLKEFGSILDKENGAYQTGWCGKKECENLLKDFKGTIRCILSTKTSEICFNCDISSIADVVIAKAY